MRQQSTTVRITGRAPDIKTMASWAAALAIGALLAHAYHAYGDDAAGRPAHGHEPGSAWDHMMQGPAACASPTGQGQAIMGAGHGEQAAGGLASAAASPQTLLDQVLAQRALDAPSPSGDPFGELVDQIRLDAKFRQGLMSRMVSEANPAAREQLMALLASAHTPDITRLSADLMHSPDVQQRQRGLEMMVGLQGAEPQARQVLQAALSTEVDPAALSTIVAGLQPGDLRDPQEVSAMAGQLHKLAQHESPEVRAAAVLASAQWGGAAAEPGLLQALADPSPKVMQAAIDAVTATRASSDAAKDALLNLAERADVDAAMRQMALDALSNVNLDGARFNRFSQLRKNLDPQS